MTYANETFERRVRDWLHADAEHRVPDHLDAVLRLTSVQRQRPAWSSLERWLPMDTAFRPRFFNAPRLGRVALVAALVIGLLGLLLLYAGSRQNRLPPPFGLARNGEILSSGTGDIVRVDPTTHQTTTVIGGEEFDFGPLFSRDGTMFSFLRGAPAGCGQSDCGLILFVAQADGSNPRALTPPLRMLDSVDWSPDSRRLAILSQAPTGPGHVIDVVNVDGSGMAALDVGRPAHEASWLPPDGVEIVFRGEQLIPTDPPPGIFAVRPDGTGLRELTTRPAHSSNDYVTIAASPDGSLLAYRDDGDPGGFREHILDLRTGIDRILPGPKGQLGGVFSPDGSKIAILRGVDPNGVQLVVLAVDGSSAGVPLGPVASWGPDGPAINNYFWSPDGTAILANYDDEKVGRIVPIDGTAPTDIQHGEVAFPAVQRLAP
jgi:hypothetical protein